MRVFTLFATGTLVVAFAATPASAAGGLAPYGPARNGSFVYAVAGDIYAADSTGANGVPITKGPATNSAPSFSRDGSRIAFLREESGAYPSLMVARADGPDVVALSDVTDLFDWSPDGTQLVVNHDVGGRPSVSLVAADGSGDVRRLDLDGIEPADGWAAWRPTDGSELIFTGHPMAGSSDMGLYAIHADGSGLRTIGAVSTSESDEQVSFNDPQLAPDGSRVAYWNWELSDAGVLDGYLHLRDLDTGIDERVGVRAQPEAEIDPRFSPDSTMVVVEAQSESEELSQLVVAPVDGHQPGVAVGPTFSYKDEREFAFSPDGAMVVLTVNGMTSVIDVTTGRATIMPGITSFPAWQRLARGLGSTTPSPTPTPGETIEAAPVATEAPWQSRCEPGCHGPITAGTFTSAGFMPGLEMDFTNDAWFNTADYSDEIEFDSGDRALRFWQTAMASSERGEPLPDVSPTVEGLTDWFVSNPDMVVSEPEAVTLGDGIGATTFTLTISDTNVNVDPGCPSDVRSCLSVLWIDEGHGFGIGYGEAVRLYLFSIGSDSDARTIIASLDAPTITQLSWMTTDVAPILESLRLPQP